MFTNKGNKQYIEEKKKINKISNIKSINLNIKKIKYVSKNHKLEPNVTKKNIVSHPSAQDRNIIQI